MALRTYLPLLRTILSRLCAYIADHEAKIKDNVGEENVDKVDAVVTACEILTAVLDTLIPHGT